MGVRDINVLPTAHVGRNRIVIPVITAISLTGAVIYSFTPGYQFQLTRCRSFARTLAGAVSAVIKVGGRTAVSVTFTAATEVAQTLSTTLANIRGLPTDAITVELTTDGSGVLTNGSITLAFRPYPMNGESAGGP